MNGGMTWVGEHTLQYTDDVYRIVTPINSIKIKI